jgi:hypothetical protein
VAERAGRGERERRRSELGEERDALGGEEGWEGTKKMCGPSSWDEGRI